MLLIDQLDKITQPFKGAVITIGNFDGVHIGHQALFYEVIEKAYAIGGTSIAMTFEPHPLRLLQQHNRPPLITLLEQKVELLAATGFVDRTCVLHFDEARSKEAAEDFVRDVIEPEVTGAAKLGYDEVLHPDWYEPHAGLDESGKGDFFGPVIAALVGGELLLVRVVIHQEKEVDPLHEEDRRRPSGGRARGFVSARAAVRGHARGATRPALEFCRTGPRAHPRRRPPAGRGFP